jgi:hypothetical protein
MLGWDRYQFDKICIGTSYAKLLFLHPMGYAGDVVHSGASGEQNISALFFMLEWDRYGLHKKRAGTRYAE